MKFIATYPEACAFLNRSTDRPDVSQYPAKKQKRLNADHDLEIILEANNMIANDGKKWEADLANKKQRKYYPAFDIDEDEDAPGGFRLSFRVYAYVSSIAALGARHACINADVATFVGENCADIYHDTLS